MAVANASFYRIRIGLVWVSLAFMTSYLSAQTSGLFTSAERSAKWKEDLEYVKERFPAYDKTLTPLIYLNHYQQKLYYYTQQSVLEEFITGINVLQQRVDSLSDEQIMMELSRLIALSPNAHTRLYLFRVRTLLNNLPVGIYWFGKDLYVVAATKPYRSLLGVKIKSINGVDIDSVKKKVDDLISGNKSWERYMSLYFLRSPQALKGLSYSTNANELQLTVVSQKGKGLTVTVIADFVPQSTTLEVWKDLSPQSINKDSLMHVLPADQLRLPLYLQNTDKNYSYQYVAEDSLVYLQFNRTQNSSDITFKDYVANMLNEIKDKPYTKFVLDLRFNTGGDNDVAIGALEALAMQLQNKEVYMITGIATFSAGVVSAAVFKKCTGAKIVGEPAGDGLIFLSEGGNVVLPNSKINAHYSNGFHHWNFNNNFSVLPDIPVVVSFEDYLKGKDTVLDYILKDKQKTNTVAAK